MNKFFLVFGIIAIPLSLLGKDVTESLAIKMANEYYRQVKVGKSDTMIDISTDLNLNKPERISPLGKANMWLVPVENNWIILSGSTKTTPILAHILSQKKPIYDSMPPAMQEILNSYENYIAYVNNHDGEFNENEKWSNTLFSDTLSAKNVYKSQTTEVQLSMSVNWEQSGGGFYCDRQYNKYCPYNNAPPCNKAVVGCAAVAMAQIMWYWKWPYSAYIPTTVGGNNYELRFYDWSLMPESIGNSTPMEKVDMIAGFLRDCGYKLNTIYGASSSANVTDVPNAFIEFGYDENSIELCYKNNTSNWNYRLRSNIDNAQPLFYSGYNSEIGTGGHGFVVHGYRTGDNPTYLINWGFGGSNNGWFNLDDEATSYYYQQSAIFGIRPDPICDDMHLNGPFLFTLLSKFCLVIGGSLTISNNTLQNIVRGELYSGTQVRLLPGLTIQQGSNVHIAIKDVPCSEATKETTIELPALTMRNKNMTNNESETNKSFSITPNPVRDILTITSIEDIIHIDIYNVNGLCVLQSKGKEFYVGNLSAGVYLLRAVLVNGKTMQGRFIKQ